MGMVVRSNIMAMNANRQLGMNNSAVSKSLEKLSSGFKINRAGDDASGLAISEKMKAQIKGLETASANSQDGISLVQTAEGALTEVHSMLNRMVELATKSANGTIQDQVDRDAIQSEVNALLEEIDRIGDSTNFNGINLLDGSLGSNSLVNDMFKVGGSDKLENNTALDLAGKLTNVVNGHKPETADKTTAKQGFYIGKAGTKLQATNGDGTTDGKITITFNDKAGNEKTVTIELGNSSTDTLVSDLATEKSDFADLTGATAITDVSDAIADFESKLAAAEAEMTADNTNGAANKAKVDIFKTALDTFKGLKTTFDDAVQALADSTDPAKYEDLTKAITDAATALSGGTSALNTAADLINEAGDFTAPGAALTALFGAANDIVTATTGTTYTDALAAIDPTDLVGAADALIDMQTNGASLTTEGLVNLLNDVSANGALAAGDEGYTSQAAGSQITIGGDGIAELKEAFDISLSHDGEIIFTAKESGEVEQSITSIETTGFTQADLDKVQEIQYDPDGSSAAVIEWGSEVAGHKVEGVDGGTANYIVSSADLDLSGVNHGGAITVAGKTYVFQKDGEELTDASYQLAAKSGVQTIKFTDADDAAKKLARLVDDGDNGITAAANGSKITFKEDTHIGLAQQNKTDLEQIKTDALKFEDLIKSTLAADAYNTVVTMGEQPTEGVTATINGTKFSFHQDATNAPDGTVGVAIGADAAATMKNLADAYNTAKGLEDGDAGYATSADGKITFAFTEASDISISGDYKGLTLQVGDTSDDFNKVSVSVDNMKTEGLGIKGLDVSNQQAAGNAINVIKDAINKVSTNRANLGALQNRLEYTINNLDVSAENLSAANSRIRDTDMAKEMMNYTKMNVLTQAAQAMLAQANQQPQSILQLLQ